MSSSGTSGMPTDTLQKDLVQMVCGKLTDEGRQLNNIQLVVEERQLKLCNVEGVYSLRWTLKTLAKNPLGVEEG